MKMHIGPGQPEEGYAAVSPAAAYPLRTENDTLDEVRVIKTLERYSHRQASAVVNEWVSKLGPGGRMVITVPDLEKVSRRYLEGAPVNVQGMLMGEQESEEQWNASLYDRETLAEVMANAGLVRIADADGGDEYCITLQGFKPSGDETRVTGLLPVLSAPRYGPVMHFKIQFGAFSRLGLEPAIGQGAFWHQVLSEQMESIMASGAEFVMSLDYDSIFSREDVLELYRLMKAYPEIDAICPTQMKRGCGSPLFGIRNKDGTTGGQRYASDFDRNLTRVYTGHFGATIIRCDKLRKLPRPWMLPVPAGDGRWNEGDPAQGIHGKTDADIYFWQQWHKAGFTLAVANRVVIGHLEELITWPGMDFKPVHQSVVDYAKHGIPKEVLR